MPRKEHQGAKTHKSTRIYLCALVLYSLRLRVKIKISEVNASELVITTANLIKCIIPLRLISTIS